MSTVSSGSSRSSRTSAAAAPPPVPTMRPWAPGWALGVEPRALRAVLARGV